ncbi:energy-coupling factor ABC transporter ATP-binding protein [Promethearchaeum syntrophicum]|uniref:Energy-coupling factor ABC transporter ATP-binding protein n=1 Tax=Promethearchaeum syntrophicum TaxID=2594042 RepID=A0A5B9D9P1_9ARCH|nr:ABC transporter ATP-binding protein [Candidatus Prometheoarchaeum syntrophicum]QEE15822.1 putative ABC transporter ATP-binding protein [Candidatus Prometheoarchaeum syntrophicum]
MSNELQIKVKDLHFSFFPQHEILKGINLELKKGESLIILGENGSGKSTFFLNLLNLLPNYTGKIEISGKEVNRKNEKDIRKRVGIMFQNPNDQLFLPTVLQELEFGPSNLGINGKELKSRIKYVIDTLKLHNLIDKKTFHLSYGEKKKIAFASIFSMDPEIYLLDEPYANLDPRTKKEFSEIFENLNQKKKSMLIISHDLDKIPKFIKRTIVIHQGEILFDGLINDLYNKMEILQKANLDLPILSILYLKLKEELHLKEKMNFPRDINDFLELLKNTRKDN